jgi:hypothetical protein
MKYKKLLIRISLGLLMALVVVFTMAPLVLYKNQDKLTKSILEDINKNFVGELTIERSYISPFKSFPYISIDLHNLEFFENKDKNTTPIYRAEDLYAGFNVFDILKGQFNIKTIKITGGHLHLVQDKNGELNLMKAKKSPEEIEESDEEGFSLDLKHIILKSFEITKLNEETGQRLEIDIADAKASFSMKDDHLFVGVDTKFILNVVEGSDTSYFRDKHMEFHSILDYDMEEEIIRLTSSKLMLEDAVFNVEGTVDFDDNLNIDLQLRGDKPDFNLLIAFAPNEVAENLKRYKNQGRIYFNGKIKGQASGGHSPLVEIEFGCENAFFNNPVTNKTLDELTFKGYYTNGEARSLETSIFRLTDIHAKPEQGIFEGNFVIRNFADPYINMNLYSDLDLQFLEEFLGLEGLRGLTGQVIVNMKFNELVDITVPETQLVRLKEGIDSELIVKNLGFKMPGHPHPIRQLQAHAQMENGRVVVDKFSFKMGNSDISLNGFISDLPSIFHHQQKPIEIGLNAKSKKLVFKELLAFNPALADSTEEEITNFSIKMRMETTVDNLENANPLPKGEFFIEDFYAKMKNYPHTFHDFHADVVITENDLQLKDFSGEIDKTDFHFSGLLKNYPLWFVENKKGDTTFEFDLTSKHFALHDLLSYKGENYLPEDYRDEEINQLKLHGRVELHYDSMLTSTDLYLTELDGKLKVHPLKLEDFSGRFHYEDEHLLVEKFNGKMGNSDFTIDMAYYTGEDPKIKRRDNFFDLVSSRLDLDQLMNYNPNEDSVHEEAFNIFMVPFTDMRMTATIKGVNYHKILLDDVQAKIRMTENHFLYIDTLKMYVAGGEMGMKGYFNGSKPEEIYFKSDITAKNMDLDKLMFKMDNFGQDVMISDNLHGKLSGKISSMIRVHPDLTPILDKGEAHMEVSIHNGSLVDFGPMQAMSGFFRDKNLRIIRFDTLTNTLDLKNGTLFIPNMSINSSLGYIELSGKQSLDLSMDYFIRVPWQLVSQVGVQTLFGGKKKEEVDPDQIDAIEFRRDDKRVRFLNLRITGSPDDYKISLGKAKKPI